MNKLLWVKGKVSDQNVARQAPKPFWASAFSSHHHSHRPHSDKWSGAELIKRGGREGIGRKGDEREGQSEVKIEDTGNTGALGVDLIGNY